MASRQRHFSIQVGGHTAAIFNHNPAQPLHFFDDKVRTAVQKTLTEMFKLEAFERETEVNIFLKLTSKEL